MAGHILAIDQGTTSTRAIVFDGSLRIVAASQQEFRQHYPRSGWVEHDPEGLHQLVRFKDEKDPRLARAYAAVATSRNMLIAAARRARWVGRVVR